MRLNSRETDFCKERDHFWNVKQVGQDAQDLALIGRFPLTLAEEVHPAHCGPVGFECHLLHVGLEAHDVD